MAGGQAIRKKASDGPSRRPVVFVVEDDVTLRRSLATFLRRFAEPVEFGSVRELLDAAEKGFPTALVCDVHLPDGIGLDGIAALRTGGFRGPVLVLTGANDDNIVARAQLHGAFFLRKPAPASNLAAFVQVIEEWAESDRHRVERAVEEIATARRLSPRERRAVLLAATGTTRADLPFALDVEENTAKTLVRRALQKCGFPRLKDLVADVHRAALRGD